MAGARAGGGTGKAADRAGRTGGNGPGTARALDVDEGGASWGVQPRSGSENSMIRDHST